MLFRSGTLHFCLDENVGASNASLSTSKLQLDYNGNLGLGVTPSAWGSGKCAIENIGYALWSGSASNFLLGNNVYQNSGGSYIYKNTAAATMYYQNNGSNIWYNAPSGTAGTAISFTQAMTLDASGNLVLGTTSALSGGKFSIQTDLTTTNGIVLKDTEIGRAHV